MSTYAGVGGAVFSGTNAVAEIRDWSLELTGATADSTVMGTSGSFMTVKPTLKSWTSSFSVIWNDSDSDGQGAFVEGASVTLALYPSGNSSGQIKWSGAAVVTSVTKNASVDGLVEASFTVTGNGALTETTVS